jgi:hypothetical protein
MSGHLGASKKDSSEVSSSSSRQLNNDSTTSTRPKLNRDQPATRTFPVKHRLDQEDSALVINSTAAKLNVIQPKQKANTSKDSIVDVLDVDQKGRKTSASSRSTRGVISPEIDEELPIQYQGYSVKNSSISTASVGSDTKKSSKPKPAVTPMTQVGDLEFGDVDDLDDDLSQLDLAPRSAPTPSIRRTNLPCKAIDLATATVNILIPILL